MRVLLVHQNYPGQFLHLAPALEARGHEVVALTAEHNARNPAGRVARYRYTEPASDAFATARLAATYARMAQRGGVVADAANALAKKGYRPDVVFGHPGWGETLFLRDVFPQARHLSYAEFCYRSTGLDTGFDPEFRREGLLPRALTTARAAHLIQSVATADSALAPTRFQAASFPASLRHHIQVIHDGVDTARLGPDPRATLTLPGGPTLRAGDEVLTFVNRNLEPYRGFHIFMRALPAILAARPHAQVVLVGGDGVSYGGAPEGGGSWKARLLAELDGRLDLSRVHFPGKLPYADYVRLLQVARVHAYLTYPFVLSWSLIEAMAIGPTLVGSRTAPVEEVLTDGVHARLVDFFDVAGWSETLIASLADPVRDAPLRAAARARAVAEYDQKRVCLPRLVAFTETAGLG